MDRPRVVLYYTSTPSTHKVRSDTQVLQTLLIAKSRFQGIDYEEVDLSEGPWARRQMLQGRGASIIHIPQLHVGGVFLGGLRRVQDLEDEGLLNDILLGHQPPTPPSEEAYPEYWLPLV